LSYLHRADPRTLEYQVRALAAQAQNPHSDGFTASVYKHELYMLKCLIEDLYQELPHFEGEELWEQERLIELLRRR